MIVVVFVFCQREERPSQDNGAGDYGEHSGELVNYGSQARSQTYTKQKYCTRTNIVQLHNTHFLVFFFILLCVGLVLWQE